MLKYITTTLGSILVLAILAVGAYVPPTYAASAPVVLMQIQAGGSGAALQELVALYNNSSEEVNLTGWCLQNKSSVKFACFTSESPDQAIYLPPHSTATVSSTALSTYFEWQRFSLTYDVSNQSSGSIVGGSDTISLLDAEGAIVDSHSWTTSLVGGMMFERVVGTLDPFTYVDSDQASDWQLNYLMFMPDDLTEIRTIEVLDVCANLAGIQTEVPAGYTRYTTDECQLHVAQLYFSELLPNAVGSDAGQEFIELYNPNDYDVPLSQYILWAGPALDKSYQFPTGSIIPAHSYLSFSNQDIAYSLLNTSSSVRLTAGDEVIDEVPAYSDPADGAAWALVDGSWQYAAVPTPGAANTTAGIVKSDEAIQEPTVLKPCAANQYRSEETNRCRLIASAQAAPTPCKDNQYRSEETNRCRNIAAETGPAPCAEGQERNPETNRCRTIKAIAAADYAVLGVRTSNGGAWYLWLVIGLLCLVVLGYGIWEWRYEIGKLLHRIKVAVLARVRK